MRPTKPLGILSDTTQEVAKGNFDTALPTFKHNDEISQLRDSFDTMQHSLARYVEELKASTAAKASIERELKVASGRLTYCNGGHNAPYIQSDSLPVEPNLPIGIFPDWEFVEQEMVMEPGSTIFLYTDGLTKAENATHDQFGEDRMTAILAAQTQQGASTETLISAMTDAVHEFVGDTEQSDDLTMFAIKYTKV